LRASTAERAGHFAIDPRAVEINLGAKDKRVGLEVGSDRGATDPGGTTGNFNLKGLSPK
jgi:hypothetical protein